ncbi:MAG: extracellular solute-binding protein, partial [Clostridia bacterium]|nr:extracellular solute-binding protein [Clostridia bacterium]
CTPVQAFFKVVFPQLIPGILSGLLMAFTLSFDDFVISYYTSGADFVTLPVYIYSLVKKTVKPDVYALYTIIFIAILVLLIGYNALQNKETGKKSEKKKKSSVIRLVAFGVAAVLLVVGLFTFTPKTNVTLENLVDESYYESDLAGTTLNVYNWAEYISDGEDDTLDVIAAFEDLTGINVNYVTYESNEVMYSKLQSGSVSYDIIIPSDYMIARMISDGSLRKLDFEKIPNYSFIDEKYKNMYFDPENEYSVPFSVGMVGLIYNTTMVDGTPDSWSLMWDEQYKGQIITFNNSRDAFMIAQMMAGVDLNSTDKADWDKAASLLKSQRPLLQGYYMDEVFNKMEAGNAAIAPYYAGDFLTMQEENEDLEMIYPKEGTTIFVDSICVPTSAKNYDAAMMFINFLLEPEVATANAEYICYATPNTAVLANEDYSLRDNEYLYPENYDEIVKNAVYYKDLPSEIRNYYESLWIKVKSE